METASGTERPIARDQPSVRGLDAQEDSGLLTVNPLGSLLRGCVVRVEGDGEFSGSGFLVAPGEVLTCAHVVHGRDAFDRHLGRSHLPGRGLDGSPGTGRG